MCLSVYAAVKYSISLLRTSLCMTFSRVKLRASSNSGSAAWAACPPPFELYPDFGHCIPVNGIQGDYFQFLDIFHGIYFWCETSLKSQHKSQVRKPKCNEKCNRSRWWGWGGAYNVRNCCGMAQARRFPLTGTQIIIVADGVMGRGAIMWGWRGGAVMWCRRRGAT